MDKKKKENKERKKIKCKNIGCNQSFDWCMQLNRHKSRCQYPEPVRSYKTIEVVKRYKCNKCQKVFSLQSAVSRNCSKTDCLKQRKVYTCSKCQKQFLYKSLLAKHKLVHAKSQTCKECGQTCRRKDLYVQRTTFCKPFVPSFAINDNEVSVKEQEQAQLEVNEAENVYMEIDEGNEIDDNNDNNVLNGIDDNVLIAIDDSNVNAIDDSNVLNEINEMIFLMRLM